MDPYSIIEKYYDKDSQLYDVLIRHSRAVSHKAKEIASRHSEFSDELEFIEEAAMLHDIGIFLTDAPSIYCTGTRPYITHGYLGAELLRAEGFAKHARVCERHTGTGLSVDDILIQKLPLPKRDFRPETDVEQLICFCDKFFSKTKLDEELSLEHIRRKMLEFGPSHLEQFNIWYQRFM